jgi:hypothetical protein
VAKGKSQKTWKGGGIVPYKPTLFVAFVGLILYFLGYTQGSIAMQVGGVVLTGSMFAVYMVRKLKRR